MEKDQAFVFPFLMATYQKGALDALMPVIGDALRTLQMKTGLRMDELLSLMDTAGEKTVDRADRLVGRLKPLFRAASNERLVGFAAWLLSFKFIRNIAGHFIVRHLERAVNRARATAL